MPDFLRTMRPDELWREMHSSDLARVYDVLELALDTARVDEKASFRGNCLSLVYLSVSGTPIRVKFNTRDAKSLPLYGPGAVIRAFDEIYISHDAVAGGKAVILLDWDLRT